MKPKYNKKAHDRAAHIINRKRGYGALQRVARPRGLKTGAQTKRLGEAMLEQHMMAGDVVNILICNAYRLGFKAGRASKRTP